MGSYFLYTELVEKGRTNLYDTAKRYGMTAVETIQASQYLDEILNLSKHQLGEKETACTFNN